jgi:hypothetical protein
MIAFVKREWRHAVSSALVVIAFALPSTSIALRWMLAALYAMASIDLARKLVEQRWILIAVSPGLRVAHGLEHATLAVLEEQGLPVARGYAYARDRFVVALDGDCEHHVDAVEQAANAAIRRVLAGERALVYHRYCGTSHFVGALVFWAMLISAGLGSIVLGNSVALTFALTVILGPIWGALEVPLGLVAQRLFTVSPLSSPAAVASVRSFRESGETHFHIVVDIPRRATTGGLVIPGIG